MRNGWKIAATSLLFTAYSVAEAFANRGHGHGHGHHGGSAPEIDGPAGMAALAIVTSIGLYVYNRCKR